MELNLWTETERHLSIYNTSYTLKITIMIELYKKELRNGIKNFSIRGFFSQRETDPLISVQVTKKLWTFHFQKKIFNN